MNAFDAHPILRWVLLAAAVAPLILAWIIARDHQLSWPRGEMTAVVAMIALVLVLYVGVIARPGEPRSQISLQFGWFLSIAGCLSDDRGRREPRLGTERPRKPPGVF